MATNRDYYEILGIDRNATEDQIKKAYRTLAKKYHPDVNKAPDAEEKFKEVNEAYSILSDPQKKATYDQFGKDGLNNAGYNTNFSNDDLNDIFNSFFGGGFSDFGFGSFGSRSSRSSRTSPVKGRDTYMTMTIDFLDAVYGTERTIKVDVDKQCPTCNGTGAKSASDISTCKTCGGRGSVMTQRRTVFGMMQSQSVCPDCNGTGKRILHRCPDCNGEGYIHKKVEIDVKIPEGISSGQQIRIAGNGERGYNGGPNGDLYIEILVRDHKYFKRQGNDIYINVPISAVDATIGTNVDIPTVRGDVEMKINPGTQPGQRYRLKEYGIKDLRSGQIGDQYVIIDVVIPTKLKREEKELYQKIRNIDEKESVFERFKKAFK